MSSPLRAVVVGAGWAGEGHTRALRSTGVEVVAICARNAAAVQAMATKLGVPEASIDWRETLLRVRPEIVSVATPAALRREVIQAAVQGGAHLYVDKPLATTAAEARGLYEMVDGAGLKHAFAVTHIYDPSVAWVAELIREGAIGPLREVVITQRSLYPPILPWSWILSAADGGGMVANGAIHVLAGLERIAGGPIVRVTGEAQQWVGTAPVVPDLHDFREWMARGRELTPESAAQYEQRAVDTDVAFSALLRLAGPQGDVRATMVGGVGPHPPGETNRLRFYGEQGMLVADGTFAFTGVARMRPGAPEAEPLPVPERLVAQLPHLDDGPLYQNWAALARDFVADVRGEPHQAYPTLRDGWRLQEVIDTIRESTGWHDVPTEAARPVSVAG